MRILFIGLANLVLAASSASAQEKRLDTIHEIAACATLDRIVEDLVNEVDRNKEWISRNRNSSSVSRDRFNKRVDENNGKVDELNELDDAYIAQCNNASFSRADVRTVCEARTTSMSKFLYDSPFCQRMRVKLNE